MGWRKPVWKRTARYLAFDLGTRKIRVNCISAGPVQTFGGTWDSGFSTMMKHYQEHAPCGEVVYPEPRLAQRGFFLLAMVGRRYYRAGHLC